MRLLAMLAVCGFAHPALAQPVDDPADDAGRAVAVDELVTGLPARRAWTGLVATTRGGYDAGTRSPVLSGTLDATVLGRITLRAAAHHDGTEAHAGWGAFVDVARQGSLGIDLVVGAEYMGAGWNRVPAVIARIAAGRSFGATRVLANTAFGLGTEEGERYGELQLAALHAIAPRVFAGLDTRARIDLERDADEPPGEHEWDVVAGPVVAYATGRIAVSAQAGVTAVRRRTGEEIAGASGTLGVAVAF